MYFWALYATGKSVDTTAMLKNLFVAPNIVNQFENRLDRSIVPKYSKYIMSRSSIIATEILRTSKSLSSPVQAEWDKIRETYLNPYFAPLLAESFVGLPPTIIYAAQHDILRDDSFYYAKQLREAGIPVQFFLDAHGYHGDFWKNYDKLNLTEAILKLFK